MVTKQEHGAIIGGIIPGEVFTRHALGQEINVFADQDDLVVEASGREFRYHGNRCLAQILRDFRLPKDGWTRTYDYCTTDGATHN